MWHGWFRYIFGCEQIAVFAALEVPSMSSRIPPRAALLGGLGALVLLMLFGSLVARAQPDPGPGLVPIHTSPIDITGFKLQLRTIAPDRDTGKPVEVTLPVALLGPKMNQLFSTPLSVQLDQYWNAKVDPATGMTARQAACDGNNGIRQQVAQEVAKQGASYSAYDISCNLATSGQLLVKQIGSTMILAYQLADNKVSFASTSPDTCKAGHGTIFCPNDPRFTVHFATQIITAVRMAGICQLFADNGTVNVVAASFEATNGAAGVAKFFAGQKFVAGEVAMTNTVSKLPLPLDSSFKELRDSDACKASTPGVSRILAAFPDIEAVIDRSALVLQASHAGIAPPALDAPNPGAAGPVQPPSVPSFTRPMVSTSQPLVTAGNAVQAKGQHFPPSVNLSTALPLSMQHGGAFACFGGATELEWGPVGGRLRVERIEGDAQGRCATHFDATSLAPNTAYQFRARDCDLITCSQRSAILKSTTAKVEPDKNKVVLTLDGGVPLGTASVDGAGIFEASVTIPAATPAGPHRIHAVNGDAVADAAIQVSAPAPAGGGRASITMVGVLQGETACPNHPISSSQTDDTFMLFGSGFAPGTVTVHLDTGGAVLGSATVRPDGSICQRMQSAPGNKAGAHTLVAVQNGAVVAQTDVTFVPQSGGVR